MANREIVLCHPVRTAIGTYNGSLKETPATALGASVVRETLCQRRRDSRPAWRSKSRPVAGRMRRHSKGPDRAPLRAGCENFR